MGSYLHNLTILGLVLVSLVLFVLLRSTTTGFTFYGHGIPPSYKLSKILPPDLRDFDFDFGLELDPDPARNL